MTDTVHRVECVVVGAGAVGLAVARALALEGREVLIIEANGRIGEEASSRSNEVVHAGFLYPPGSLKERLCLSGRAALIDYCDRRGVSWQQTGKLLPATSEAEIDTLHVLLRRAGALGLHAVRWLDAGELRDLEPGLTAPAALYSPQTGIVDSHALLLALLADAEAGGAVLATRARALALQARPQGRWDLAVESPGRDVAWLECEQVVNAGGLGALALARTVPGYPQALLPHLQLAHGSFYAWQGRAPMRHLVMPVGATLRAGGAFTLDLAGQGRFGPRLQWIEQPDYQVAQGAAADFAAAIARYWPAVDAARLAPAYAGIQPRALDADGQPRDWMVQGPVQHGMPGLVNLFAIDSPGLTACLAIAEHVLALLEPAAQAPTPPH